MGKSLTVQGALHKAETTPAVALVNLGKGLCNIEGTLKDVMDRAACAGKSAVRIRMEDGVAKVLCPTTDNFGRVAGKTPRGWFDYKLGQS